MYSRQKDFLFHVKRYKYGIIRIIICGNLISECEKKYLEDNIILNKLNMKIIWIR